MLSGGGEAQKDTFPDGGVLDTRAKREAGVLGRRERRLGEKGGKKWSRRKYEDRSNSISGGRGKSGSREKKDKRGSKKKRREKKTVLLEKEEKLGGKTKRTKYREKEGAR